ncbi:MAG: DUF3127 domain-containing protein [Bacteroidales bacterium]
MELQLEGIVRELLPIQEGQGRNGTWRKQSFILETAGGQYPRHVCIMVWGDRIDQFRLQSGDQIIASIDIESREYNGRWYTDIKAWKVEKKGAAPAPAGQPGDDLPPVADPQPPGDPNDPFTSEGEGDDLPF